jgi:hypothetical protein
MYYSKEFHPFFNKTNIVNYLHIDYRDIERMFSLNNRCIIQLVNGRSHSIKFEDLIPVMLRARSLRTKDLIVKPHIHQGDYGIYYVHNHHKNSEYQVTIEGNNHSCTCEDFKGMNEYVETSPKLPCKHILATRNYVNKHGSFLKVR